ATILAALKERRKGQTTLIIAHRLSTVLHADKIIVLAGGKVVQSGNHHSLSTSPGIYQQLCEIQGAIQQQLETDIIDVAKTQ
ncbi:MAG: ABC-type multidrug transport system fused ATPase/permease subunit, partial [Candidatus Azotimanducaceae bacterium]